MNNPGEILPLATLAAPDVAVITTIAAAHIGHMGSLQAIAEEKATLFDRLPPSGTAILPEAAAHQPTLRAHAPGPVLTFGAEPAEVRALSTTFGPGWHCRRGRRGRHPCQLPPERAGCAHGGERAGRPRRHARPRPRCRHRRRRPAGVPARRRPRRPAQDLRRHGCCCWTESYNASSVSVRAALDVLRLMPAARRIAVLGRHAGTRAVCAG